ncbi:MAG: hypothetical protein BroJett021_15640 [Chloroflexota bacterium]|jgi:hypothetical protein|nr:hypothetical protein [Caldilinea sp.]GIK72576.1 MAG: hypothetical protein BroJett021_15640 [Chloroflexota bacterium]
MSEAPAPQQIPLPALIHRSSQQYRWSRWITVVILLVQALFFLGASGFLLFTIDWDVVDVFEEPPAAVLEQFQQAIVLLPFAFLVLVSVVGCVVRPRFGWHMAMIVESLILLVALQVYLSDRNQVLTERPLLFLYMLGAILVVIFMNSPEGRLLLGSKPERTHSE